MKKYHLITGMPRSGTTVFTAILNQNPRFHSEPSDILSSLFIDLYLKFNRDPHGFMLSNEVKVDVLSGLFESYYKKHNKEVLFNTHRSWVQIKNVITQVIPEIKVLCFVREIPLILNSFEKSLQKNPITLPEIYNTPERQLYHSVEERCKHLYENKILPYAASIRELSKSKNTENVMFIEYEYLCENPNKVLKSIYEFINEPYFEHNFNDVGVSYELYDLFHNSPGLHTTSPKIMNDKPEIVIPDYILKKYDIGKYWT